MFDFLLDSVTLWATPQYALPSFMNLRGGFMRVRDIRLQGVNIWPPQWAWHQLPERGVLKNVKVITRTGLLRIDVYFKGKSYMGIILAEIKDLESLCSKLKENIGKSLYEIGDLEIDFQIIYNKVW
jgi:predicted DNA-binding transcriptional regulator